MVFVIKTYRGEDIRRFIVDSSELSDTDAFVARLASLYGLPAGPALFETHALRLTASESKAGALDLPMDAGSDDESMLATSPDTLRSALQGMARKAAGGRPIRVFVEEATLLPGALAAAEAAATGLGTSRTEWVVVGRAGEEDEERQAFTDTTTDTSDGSSEEESDEAQAQAQEDQAEAEPEPEPELPAAPAAAPARSRPEQRAAKKAAKIATKIAKLSARAAAKLTAAAADAATTATGAAAAPTPELRRLSRRAAHMAKEPKEPRELAEELERARVEGALEQASAALAAARAEQAAVKARVQSARDTARALRQRLKELNAARKARRTAAGAAATAAQEEELRCGAAAGEETEEEEEAAAALTAADAETVAAEALQPGRVVFLQSIRTGRNLRANAQCEVNANGGRGPLARWVVAERRGDCVQLRRLGLEAGAARDASRPQHGRRRTSGFLRITRGGEVDAAGTGGRMTWLRLVDGGDGTVALQSVQRGELLAVRQADGAAAAAEATAGAEGKDACRLRVQPAPALTAQLAVAAAAEAGEPHDGHRGHRGHHGHHGHRGHHGHHGHHGRHGRHELHGRRGHQDQAHGCRWRRHCGGGSAEDVRTHIRRVEEKLMRLREREAELQASEAAAAEAAPEAAATAAAATATTTAAAATAAAAASAEAVTAAPLEVGQAVRLQSTCTGHHLCALPDGTVSADRLPADAQCAVFEVLAGSEAGEVRLRNVGTGRFLRITTAGVDCSGSGGAWTRLRPLRAGGLAEGVLALQSTRFARPAFVAVGPDGSMADAHDFASEAEALETPLCQFTATAVVPGVDA